MAAWAVAVSWYDVLAALDPSPVVGLNRAGEVAERDGASGGPRPPLDTDRRRLTHDRQPEPTPALRSPSSALPARLPLPVWP